MPCSITSTAGCQLSSMLRHSVSFLAPLYLLKQRPAVGGEHAGHPPLAAIVARNPLRFPLDVTGAPPPTTDDWPYVYHRSHSIPRTYLTISLILLAMAIFLVRGTLKPGKASSWHFFFLGAGFLLLETQLISRLALYFFFFKQKTAYEMIW